MPHLPACPEFFIPSLPSPLGISPAEELKKLGSSKGLVELVVAAAAGGKPRLFMIDYMVGGPVLHGAGNWASTRPVGATRLAAWVPRPPTTCKGCTSAVLD